MTNVLEVKVDIGRLRQQVDALRAESVHYVEEKLRAMSSEPYTPMRASAAQDAQQQIDRIEAEIQPKLERISVLEAKLPTDAEVAEARVRAERLSEALATARSAFDERSAELVTACGAAVASTYGLLEARSSVQDLIGQIDGIIRQFGLDIRPPAQAAMLLSDLKFIQLSGTLVLQAAERSPDRHLIDELRSAASAREAATV